MFATRTGYQPTAARGDWVTVAVEDRDSISVHLAMVPASVGTVVTVKELMPYDTDVPDAWRAAKLRGMGPVDGRAPRVAQDLRASTVIVRSISTTERHKLLALPLSQNGLLRLTHVTSGMHCSSMIAAAAPSLHAPLLALSMALPWTQ